MTVSMAKEIIWFTNPSMDESSLCTKSINFCQKPSQKTLIDCHKERMELKRLFAPSFIKSGSSPNAVLSRRPSTMPNKELTYPETILHIPLPTLSRPSIVDFIVDQTALAPCFNAFHAIEMVSAFIKFKAPFIRLRGFVIRPSKFESVFFI